MNRKPALRLQTRPVQARRLTVRMALQATGVLSLAAVAAIAIWLVSTQTLIHKKAYAAVTYTTFSNGTWTNITNVWSTNGSTACGCNPGNSLQEKNIVINHPINLNTDITLAGGSVIYINASGSLINENQNLMIEDGIVESYGEVDLKEIEIKENGTGLFFGPVTSAVKFLVSGTILFDSLATVTNGNLELKGGSVTTAGQGWQINLLNGNLYAEGVIEFDGSCLILPNGDFQNKSGGEIRGYGYIETTNGNIQNDGIWDAEVLWCASGTGNNLPTSEACMSGPCVSGGALPVQFVRFEVEGLNGGTALGWSTAAEVNNDYFTVERSSDGINFEPRFHVKGAGHSAVFNEYSATDSPVADGIYFYRLRQTDYNGMTTVLGTRTVTVKSDDAGKPAIVSVYPNPFDDALRLSYRLAESQEVTLVLISSMGKEVMREKVNALRGINCIRFDSARLCGGVYHVMLLAGDNKTMAKAVKHSM